MTRTGTVTPASRSATASSRKATPSERAPSATRCRPTRHEPVAVGIALDDRHQPRPARPPPGSRGKFSARRSQADLDDRRPQRAGVFHQSRIRYLGTMPLKRGMTSFASNSIECSQALGFSL